MCFQTGNFTLSVTFHSYMNPDSLCGECRPGVEPVCCDTFNQTENCPKACLFRFLVSLEQFEEPLHYVPLPARPPDFRTDNFTIPEGLDAFNVSNISNPFTLQLDTWTVSDLRFADLELSTHHPCVSPKEIFFVDN